MADKFKNIAGHVTNVKGSTIENSFNSQAATPAEVDMFLKAVTSVLSSENPGAAADAVLERMQVELAEESPDKTLLQECWDGLVEICPTLNQVADLASKAIAAFG